MGFHGNLTGPTPQCHVYPQEIAGLNKGLFDHYHPSIKPAISWGPTPEIPMGVGIMNLGSTSGGVLAKKSPMVCYSGILLSPKLLL